jgi:GNAT superfamily N-acetyltransferase
MYSMTEVELSHPALLELFAALADSLGKTGQDELTSGLTGTDVIVAVVAWHDGKAVGCGLLRREDQHKAEIRRMYSNQPGVGSAILQYLELYAGKHDFTALLSAVRIINSKAVNFFLHKGFKKCAGYGKYRYSSQVICLEKALPNIHP